MARHPGWEAVRDPADRRKVVYWRLLADVGHSGAVSRKDDGWRALAYRKHERPLELGPYPTRRAAERAVEAHAEGETG